MFSQKGLGLSLAVLCSVWALGGAAIRPRLCGPDDESGVWRPTALPQTLDAGDDYYPMLRTAERLLDKESHRRFFASDVRLQRLEYVTSKCVLPSRFPSTRSEAAAADFDKTRMIWMMGDSTMSHIALALKATLAHTKVETSYNKMRCMPDSFEDLDLLFAGVGVLAPEAYRADDESAPPQFDPSDDFNFLHDVRARRRARVEPPEVHDDDAANAAYWANRLATGVLVVNFGLWYNMEYAGDLVGCSVTMLARRTPEHCDMASDRWSRPALQRLQFRNVSCKDAAHQNMPHRRLEAAEEIDYGSSPEGCDVCEVKRVLGMLTPARYLHDARFFARYLRSRRTRLPDRVLWVQSIPQHCSCFGTYMDAPAQVECCGEKYAAGASREGRAANVAVPERETDTLMSVPPAHGRT